MKQFHLNMYCKYIWKLCNITEQKCNQNTHLHCKKNGALLKYKNQNFVS